MQLTINLQRESPYQSWGFRLTGGSDVNNTPMVVQKVNYGSPAQSSGLRNGDVVTHINGQPTQWMNHQQASDLIKNCSNQVSLNVQRPQVSTPLSPPISPQNQCVSPTGSSYSSGSLYKPQHLCATNKTGVIPSFDHVSRDYQSPLAQEKRQFYEERAKERASVTTQPHRTLPMVTPKPKSVHDYPVGCYLNYMKDPTWHQTPTRSNTPHSDKLRQVVSKYGSAPNSDKMVNLQYNSPINLYSSDNVAKALIPELRAPEPDSFNVAHSPTYQLLQEEQEHQRRQTMSPAFNRNDHPVQSHSFNTLRTSLLHSPGC